jgi:hypothetical protein
MCVASRALLFAVSVLVAPSVARAQSPTLPSDTLEANFAPRSEPGPVPELAPSLPSDTLDAGAPTTYPDSSTGEMWRDGEQDREDDEPWRHEEQNDDEEDDVRMEALQFKLG